MPALLARFSLLFSLLLVSCATPQEDLPHLLVQRLSWMDEVARVKQAKKLPVTDAKREAELLQAMEKKGTAKGLPATAVRALFAGQIDAAKQRQTEWLQQHKNTPAAKAPLPDLATTVRPALDAIGEKMLSALVTARAANAGPQTVAAARAQMTQAGYSSAVSTPALNGLQASLK